MSEGRRLRVSLTAPQFGSSFRPLVEAAAAVERLHLSGLFLFDHLVPLGDPTRPVLELSAALGALASRTRIRLGTMVLRVPLRGPAVSAAIAVTAWRMAPGRFVLGLGSGDALSAEEARRYGLAGGSLRQRLAEVAETMAAVREAAPVPIWVGGRHPRVLELAAVHADGWNGWGLEPDDVREVASSLRATNPGITVSWGGAVLLGRDEEDLRRLLAERGGADDVIPGDPPHVVARLSALAEAGVDEMVVSVLPNRAERWELFARQVLPDLPGWEM